MLDGQKHNMYSILNTLAKRTTARSAASAKHLGFRSLRTIGVTNCNRHLQGCNFVQLLILQHMPASFRVCV